MLNLNQRIRLLAIVVLFALIGVFAVPPQPALAVGGTVSDEASCNDIGGSWNVDTCTVDPVIGSFEKLTIALGVTLVGSIINFGTLENYGTIEPTFFLHDEGAGQVPIINNYGIINVSAGSYFLDLGGIINNSGTITINSEFTNYRNFFGIINNSGTIINNGTYFHQGRLINGGTITNNGNFRNGRIDNSGTITNNGTLDPYSLLDNSGTIYNSHRIRNQTLINNSGTIANLCGGEITGDGTIAGNPVIDACAPVITLKGEATVTLEVGVDIYTEQGATVTDDDPDYAGSVTIGGDTVDANTIGTYEVTYDADADAAGNVPDQVVRTVIVQDTTPPVITLNGEATVTLIEGETYVEAGATVTDNSGEALSVSIGGDTVDTSTAGTYVVTYDVTDSSGNAASQQTRTVMVITPQQAIANLQGDLQTLVDNGVLKPGQANGLLQPLNNAIRSLDKGQPADACNQLQDFIDEVNAKTPEPLDADRAAGLIGQAEAIRSAIGCA